MGRFKNFFSPYIWGNLLAMLAVALAVCMLALYGIDAYTHHGEMVEVPDVVGMQETDARYTLGQLELVMVQGDKGYDKRKPTGCILDQTPKAGTKVKEGRQIFLTV
ncbi:MAG: PASTA domain-containing protein, partial [Bacteroidales bacterium]|nr:PASTA domain-containing protein [Bacteroidales bacterium]